MKEIDFDELDRAVNAIIDQRIKPAPAASHAASDDDDSDGIDQDDSRQTSSGYLSSGSVPAASGAMVDEDGPARVRSIDDMPPHGSDDASSDDTNDADDSDDSQSQPKSRKRRRFMDVKHKASASGMKVIQPLSTTDLAKQGFHPSEAASDDTKLDYVVTSKPFFDIKPARQRKASDVTFLIDREESTGELVAAANGDDAPLSQPTDDAVDDHNVSATATQDTPRDPKVESEPVSTLPVEPELDVAESVDADDFLDTLESLEVKELKDEPMVPAVPPAASTAMPPQSAAPPAPAQMTDLVAAPEAPPAIDEATEAVDIADTLDSTIEDKDKNFSTRYRGTPPSRLDQSAGEAPAEPADAAYAPAAPISELETAPVIPPADDVESPMQSPFVAEAKIEKRPLGRVNVGADDAMKTAEEAQLQTKRHQTISAPTQPPEEAPAPVAETLAPTEESAPAMPPVPAESSETPVQTNEVPDEHEDEQADEETAFNEDLPEELQFNLMELESDSTHAIGDNGDDEEALPAASELPTVLVPTPAVPVKEKKVPEPKSIPKPTPEPSVEPEPAPAAHQIPRQYSEKGYKEVESAPIYDSATYREPVATAKKKSGWWVVVAIIGLIVLGGGGGALIFLMQSGGL